MKDEEIVLFHCNIKSCYGMDTTIERVFGKALTLCRDHMEEFRDVISDIVLTEDKEWMAEWAHETLHDEVADKWDIE